MKRLILLAFVLAMTIASAWGQETAPLSDTLTVERPDRVVLETAGDTMTVRIEGREGNPEFRYSRRVVMASDMPVVTHERQSGLDFQIPFASRRSCKNNDDEGWSVVMRGPAIGWVTALDAPEEMDVDMTASYEIMFPSLLGFEYQPRNSRINFTVGFGIDWRNYRMTGKTRFYKEGEDLVLGDYKEGARPDFSRLKIFSWTMPFMMGCDFGKHVNLTLGPVINFNTHSSLKTRYELDGVKCKETTKDLHPTRVTVDLMGILTVYGVGVYVKYAPCKVIKSAYGPSFKGLSAGLTLFY